MGKDSKLSAERAFSIVAKSGIADMADNRQAGKKWKRRLLVWCGIGVVLLILLVLGSVAGINQLMDIWWFNALGYGFYYWQRIMYRYAIFAIVTLLFFSLFFSNFWIAARFLKKEPLRKGSLENTKRLRVYHAFQTGSIWFYAPLSLGLSIPVAWPLFLNWERFLFYLFGQNAGLGDPYFGRDAAFYLFSFPIYTLVQSRLLLALIVLTAGLFLLYLAKNRLLERPWMAFGRGAKWHLSLLALLLFGLVAWNFMLQRYALVYDNSHQPLFFGPGYVQMQVVLPLIWACMVSLAAAAVALVFVIQFGKGHMICVCFLLVFAGVMALRHTSFLPELVQTYIVKPNEIEKESPYIQKHLQATLDAYALQEVEVRDFTPHKTPLGSGGPNIEGVLRNIPVWDAETLAEVFQQLQELRTYYTFPLVSVGRYDIGGSQQQVFLSPREIEFSNLPGGARNWINEHLSYTHGFGVVMTPASQVSTDSMTWYLHNIPPESTVGLAVEQPRIYYGMGRYTYSFVPNGAGEMDYPKGDSNVMTDYDGRGGVPVSSLFKKFLLAYYLKDKKIFFSTQITDKSKVMLRRNILERIHYLTPFLLLDRTPYLAITEKGVYWIVDAYTTAANYPAAASATLGDDTFNYIRNSVKIVVDAYNGSVDFYLYDPRDPIIRAYDAIYPGLFKPQNSLPEALRAHIRYPKDYFDIQMKHYAKYHQKDPQVFYQQEDLWTVAENIDKNTTIPHQPYYVTLDLIEAGKMNFMLLLPMFPKNRDNLRAIAIAGCDPDQYGRLIVYNFPKGVLFYGPAQIDALINQDPDIARQFTLWDQAGSQVVRGKMIILPVADNVLFIQPVYLKATSRVKIPELQRIIMSEGEKVVMEKSVRQAFDQLIHLPGNGEGQPPEEDRKQQAPGETEPGPPRPGGGLLLTTIKVR